MDFYMGMVFPWPITFAPMYTMLCQGQSMNIQQYEALYSLMGTVFGGNGSSNFNLPNLNGRAIIGTGQGPLNGPFFTQGMTLGAYTSTMAVTAANLPQHTHGASFSPSMGTQSVVIPGSAAQGSLSASASVAALAGIPTSSVQSPAAGSSYYLTGAAAKAPSALSGLYTTVAPGAGTTSNLAGVSATVTPSSNYNPGSSATTVPITTVTGGAVAVQPGGGVPTPTPLMFSQMQPSMALNFVMCVQGLYPERPN